MSERVEVALIATLGAIFALKVYEFVAMLKTLNRMAKLADECDRLIEEESK